MDSLTHTVLGACMGEAIAGKKLGKKAMLIGAIAHNFPDIDVLYNFVTTPVNALLTHRGITHSIIFNLLLMFLATWLFAKYSKNELMTKKNWLFLIGSGLFTHILIDAFTTYGTGWYEPFSHFRVSFNVLFILDPFLLLILLVGALILLILKSTHPSRYNIATTVLLITAVYLSYTLYNKMRVDSVVKNNLNTQQIPFDNYIASPAPLSNFLWYVLANNKTDHYVAYYSVFDSKKELQFEKVPRYDSLIIPFKNNDEIKKLKCFSKGFYSIRQQDSVIVFSDARFGQLGGWFQKNTPFVFNFDIKQQGDNLLIEQSKFADFDSRAISSLYERIKGN